MTCKNALLMLKELSQVSKRSLLILRPVTKTQPSFNLLSFFQKLKQLMQNALDQEEKFITFS